MWRGWKVGYLLLNLRIGLDLVGNSGGGWDVEGFK